MRTHPVLERLARFGLRLGLGRLESFLAWIGDPHLQLQVIHVAGTNGKGSVVRMLGSILSADGRRVGEYTSPHLQHINERIRIDGVLVDDQSLSDVLHTLQKEAKAWASEQLGDELDPDRVLTYFEMMTAAAFVLFARTKVDVVVLEVGLGGRLDATNVVRPLVTCITSIGLDHMAQLGHSEEQIAAEKAGIFKRSVPAVVGSLNQGALQVVRTIARDMGAPLCGLGLDFRWVDQGPDSFSWRSDTQAIADLVIGIEGEHQKDNASVAIAAVFALPHPPAVSSIRAGLANARHPGRLEWLSSQVLVDCAHNSSGAQRLTDYLSNLPPTDGQRVLLVGVSDDKDAWAIVAPLAPFFDQIISTQCAHPRALDFSVLAERLEAIEPPVTPGGRIEEALPLAIRQGGLVVAAGSVFLAGAVRDMLDGT